MMRLVATKVHGLLDPGEDLGYLIHPGSETTEDSSR